MSSGRVPLSDGFVDGVSGRASSVRNYAVLVPSAVFLGSEVFRYFGEIQYALWGYLLALLLATLAPLRFRSDTRTFRSFVLLPVFRLVGLGMPMFFGSTLPQLLLVYGAMIPAVYLIESPRDHTSMGVRTALLALPGAIVVSALFATVEHRILAPEALVPAWNLAQVVVVGVVMVVLVGFVEELLFRGVLQRGLQDRLGRWPGLGLASVLFGMTYSAYGVPTELGYAIGAGFVLGVIYDRTESLGLVTLIHGLSNVFLFVVFPLRGPLIGF